MSWSWKRFFVITWIVFVTIGAARYYYDDVRWDCFTDKVPTHHIKLCSSRW